MNIDPSFTEKELAQVAFENGRPKREATVKPPVKRVKGFDNNAQRAERKRAKRAKKRPAKALHTVNKT